MSRSSTSLLCLLASLIFTLGGAQDLAAEPETATTTATVERIRMGKRESYQGYLEPGKPHAIDAGFEIYRGDLEIVEARAPGPVAKGDVLVRFKAEPFEEALRDARYAYRIARLEFQGKRRAFDRKLREFNLDRDDARYRVAQAKDELTWYRDTELKMRMEELERNMQASRDRLQDAKEELEQLEKMYKSDDLTEETEEIVLKRTQRRVARQIAALQNTEVRHKRRMQREFEEQTRKREMALERADLAYRGTIEKGELALAKGEFDLKRAERALKEQKEKLDKLEKEYALLSLVAPAAGVLYRGSITDGAWSDREKAQKALETGETVSHKQVLFTIVEAAPAMVRIEVPVSHLLTTRVGAPAGVDFPHDEGLRRARITAVGSLPTRNKKGDTYVSVTVQLVDDYGDVPLGIRARAYVHHAAADEPEALAVPAAAVHTRDDQSYVIVLDGENRREVGFVPAGASDGWVTIQEGQLEAGQRVLLGDGGK